MDSKQPSGTKQKVQKMDSHMYGNKCSILNLWRKDIYVTFFSEFPNNLLAQDTWIQLYSESIWPNVLAAFLLSPR